jgi:transcriptional regulator with XRE-family HTH domain
MRAIEPTAPAGRLRAARKARGLSQVAVAELTGLSQAAVSEAENAHPPTMLAVTMASLCGALGVTLEFVMHGNAAEKTAQEAEVLALLRQASPDMRDAALRTLRALLASPASDGKRRAA